jgi:inner membrane protein
LLDRGRTIEFRSHDRGVGWLDRHAEHEQVQRIARFSDGFYRLRMQDGDLLLADLRMGQEPSYVFEFNIGPPPDSTPPIHPVATQVGARGDAGAALPWLRARLLGQDLPPLSDIMAQRAPQRIPTASPTRPLDTPLPQTTMPRLP